MHQFTVPSLCRLVLPDAGCSGSSRGGLLAMGRLCFLSWTLRGAGLSRTSWVPSACRLRLGLGFAAVDAVSDSRNPASLGGRSGPCTGFCQSPWPQPPALPCTPGASHHDSHSPVTPLQPRTADSHRPRFPKSTAPPNCRAIWALPFHGLCLLAGTFPDMGVDVNGQWLE